MHNIVESFASRAELLEAENERLRAELETAKAIIMNACMAMGHPDHGFDETLLSRLHQQTRPAKEFCHVCGVGLTDADTTPCGHENCPLAQ